MHIAKIVLFVLFLIAFSVKAGDKKSSIVPVATIIASTPNAQIAPLTNGVFTVNLSSAIANDVFVCCSITGTAISDVDYYPIITLHLIPGGQTSVPINVLPYVSSSHDGATVIVTITPCSGYVVGTPNTATVTISTKTSITIVSGPTADPNPAETDESVSFSVTASSTSTIQLTYSWDFGDGTSGTGSTVTHAYAAVGTYTVTVSVDDGHQHPQAKTTSIVVNEPNMPPMIDSGPTATPNPALVNQSVSFSVQASDPDNDTLTYTWDFGDNTNGTGSATMHMYTAAGTYTATVTVDDGHQHSQSATISVIAQTPIIITINRNNNGRYSTLGDFKMTAVGFPDIVKGATLEPIGGSYTIIPRQRRVFPIPTGTYTGKSSTHYAPWCVALTDKDKPNNGGFTGLFIHIGNYPMDTNGCILVGDGAISNYVFQKSALTQKQKSALSLYTKLKMVVKIGKGKNVSWTTDIIDLGTSGTKLMEMLAFYNKVKFANGGNDVDITVIVQ